LEHRRERVPFTLGAQHKSGLFSVMPIETTLGVVQQNIGCFKKPKAGEDLSGVEKINWDARLSHYLPPFSPH
jgi:hypothetical protein